MTVAQLDREKLVRVLGLLGSAHDGEILAAAKQAERLRREASLTWPDLILPRLPPPPDPSRKNSRGADRELVDFCASQLDPLTGWERQFVLSLQDQGERLSVKQRAIVERIAAKIRAWAARKARAA